MNRSVTWVMIFVALIATGVPLIWTVTGARFDPGEEREDEPAIQQPARLSTTADGSTVVTFDAKARHRAGLATVPATAASRSLRAYGRVLDPAPLVEVDGDLETAEAMLANATAQWERTRRLFRDDQNTSRKALDAAEAERRADQTHVQLAKRRLALEWGEWITDLDTADRTTLIRDLLSHQAALVRVDLLAGEDGVVGSPNTARLTVVGREDRVYSASVLSVAPTVSGATLGEGLMLRVDASDAVMRPGAAVVALFVISNAASTGVEIPSSALVRFAGRAWVYVQLAPDRFARREVPLTEPSDRGWIVNQGIQVGDVFVVEGAQALLSEELRSQIQIGE